MGVDDHAGAYVSRKRRTSARYRLRWVRESWIRWPTPVIRTTSIVGLVSTMAHGVLVEERRALVPVGLQQHAGDVDRAGGVEVAERLAGEHRVVHGRVEGGEALAERGDGVRRVLVAHRALAAHRRRDRQRLGDGRGAGAVGLPLVDGGADQREDGGERRRLVGPLVAEVQRRVLEQDGGDEVGAHLGQLGRGDAAEGVADDDGRSADELLEHGRGVADVVGDAVVAGRPVGTSVAPEVEPVQTVGRQLRDQEVVRPRARADAVQQQRRVAVLRPVDVDLEPDPMVVDPHAGDRRASRRPVTTWRRTSGAIDADVGDEADRAVGRPAARRLLEAVVDERGPRRRPRSAGRVHEQLVVQAQHDAGAEVGAAGPHGDRPHLEQLGRRALDHRVAGVPATGRGAPAGVAVADLVGVGRCPCAPADRRRCARRARPGPRRRRRRGSAMATGYADSSRRRAWAPWPVVWPYIAPSTATLAVGRSTPSCSATGAYMSSVAGRRGQRASPDTAASTRGSIWPRSARTKTWPGSATTAARRSAGMLCRPAVAVIRPGGAVGRRPRAAQPAVGADVLVEPVVAVRRRDPLGLAPRQQRLDQRVRVAVGVEPPGPGVGHLDADAPQQRPHLLGVAQVDRAARRGVAQHLVVAARRAASASSAGVRGRGPDDGGDQALGRRAVDGEAVGGQLGAQQLGRRLGPGRRRRPRAVGQGVEPRLLAGGHVEGQRGPPGQAAGDVAHAPSTHSGRR